MTDLFAARSQMALSLAGQAPYVSPPDPTIECAATPPTVLVPILGALLAGSVLLVPSFIYLYRVFEAPGESSR